MDELTDDRHKAQEDIAIIGMAGRFPGAPDIETFWANLRDGVESIVPLSDEDLLAAGVSRSTFEDPDYVKVCPVLDDVDKFDAGFFGFSPRDASVMDPTHRLFLEIAWHAFEHAGYTALPAEGAVGVFAGSGAPLYMIENLRTNPDLMRSMGDFLVRHTGNDMNFLATRVSYEMDLRGPSVNVQTACSSALVSLHMACQSLRLGECELAVAGGSTILFPQNQGYMYKEGEILSPDGHCRPFDAKSAGTVFGSGAGAIVVKRLSDALDDGDTIHAVIKGSAINNDGAMKVGYLAPGVDGQADVIREALAAADVDAASVSYVETHGTGTLVGDPIEVEALNDAYGTATDKRGYCGIGSVKSNIGHLGEAAAAASLIKAVMALKNRQLPPSLGFETPNPAINFDDSPFYVNDKLQAWTSDTPRRCAITALGAGGTNCHLILEEAPPALPGEGDRDKNLFVLSARSKAALDQASDNLADALEANPGLNLADAAYTMALGRRALAHRRTIVTGDRGETVQRLRERPAKLTVTDQALDTSPKTVFMFPGGGAQYARMGIDLYESEDVYREAVDECLDIIAPRPGKDLKALMFAAASDVETATRTLEQPALTLPALFTTEYAMASLFEAWGVEPDAFIGHSMGEYVAACKAGVMSLEDAISLVMLRGELFEVVERGSMLSVPLSETELRAILPDGVDIAAANAPDLCVASGPVDKIEALRQVLNEKDVESTPIRIDVAAHSRMLDPILDRFRSLCRTISFQPPQIPFVSNVTGKWITPTEACDPEYWVRHLRSTVRFADGLASLRSLGEPVLLEIGPGRTLSMLAKAQAQPFQKAFNSVRHPQEQASDTDYAVTSLGRLWAAGADVDWGQFYGDQLRNRVPLPGYPFERQSYWVEPGKVSVHAASEDLTKREAVSDWFYQVSYREAPLVSANDTNPKRTWLVISSSAKKARQLAEALSPETVAIATAGKALSAQSDTHWRFDLDDPDQYFELLQAVEDKLGTPDHVVMLAATPAPAMRALRDHHQVYRDFLHPAYVVQALGGAASETQFS
ncbi:MAG: type I polyketide synthase, partial [Alphaproteobacteria bacterium]|nr:type I polyketide synthase [Alphaproteobacteria bacterium]